MNAAPRATLLRPDALELRADPQDRTDLRRKRSGARSLALAVLVVAAAVAGAWWWWRAAPTPTAPSPPLSAPPQDATVSPAPAPDLHYPLPPAADATALDAGGVAAALAALLGAGASHWLVGDDLPRRLVATLDNLGRDHAPVAAWPIVPTPGRFLAADGTGPAPIAAENAARYEPFVAAVAHVDPQAAVDLYQRMYPLLQHAYRELGFGGRDFNDRVVAVLDLLLATPEPAQVRVVLPQVKGPVPSQRPWVRYEFADPSLQALSAGQKMLLRVGPANERRLKDKLRALRAELLRRSPPQPVPAR